MIRVVLVDDHAVVRAGISRILEAEPDVEVVGQCGAGHEAVSLCRSLAPDVLLLDFSLPDLDGLEVTRQVGDLRQPPRVLILTMHASEEYAYRLLRAGASGYLLKGSPAEELLVALRKVARGERHVTAQVVDRLVARIGQQSDDPPEAILSDREMQVLTRLASGKTTREIAQELSLSPSTVETYRTRLLDKLKLRNTVELTHFAIRRGLVDPG